MPPPIQTIYCRHCKVGLALTIRLGICPICSCPADWLTYCPVPTHRWNVSAEDWVFLKIQKIHPERDTEERRTP